MTRQAFEKAHHELTSDECPSKAYLESRLQQLSDGEFKTEQLSEVTSHDQEDGDDEMGSLYPTKDGTWQIRKRKAVGSMPSTTEELRVKYALMDVHWRMMALRHDGRSFAVGLEMGTWDHHLKYLMGKRCISFEELLDISTSAGARRGKGQCRAPSSSLPHSPCSWRQHAQWLGTFLNGLILRP